MSVFKMTLPLNVIIVIVSLTSVNLLQAYEIYLQNDTQNFKHGKSLKSDFASLLRNIVTLNKARMGAIQNISSTDGFNYYHNARISRTKSQGYGAEGSKVYVILTPPEKRPVSRGRKKKTKLDLLEIELGKLLKNPTKYLREVDERNKMKSNDILKQKANADSADGGYADEPGNTKDEISRIRNYYKSLNYRKQSAGVDNKNVPALQSKDDILKSHFHGDLQEKIMKFRSFFSPDERKQLKDASSKQGYKLTDMDIDLLDKLADLFDDTDVEDRLPNRQSLRFKIDNPTSKTTSKHDKGLRINKNNTNNKETMDKNQHHLQLIIKTNGNPISMRASDVEAKQSEDILHLLKNAVKRTKQSFKINHLEPLQVQSSFEDYNKHKDKPKHETLKPHRRGQFKNRLMKFRGPVNEEEKKALGDLISQNGYTLTDSDFEALHHIKEMINDETAVAAFINAFNLSDIFDNLRRQESDNLKSKLNHVLSLYKPNSEQPFKMHNYTHPLPSKHIVLKMGADYQDEVDNPISKAGFSDDYDESDDQDPVLGDLTSSEDYDQQLRLKTDDDYDMNDDIDPVLGEDFSEDENEKMDLRMYCWSDDTWDHLAFLCGKVCRKTIRDTCATIFCDGEFRNQTKSFCKIKCRQKFKRNRLHYSVPNVIEANTGKY